MLLMSAEHMEKIHDDCFELIEKLSMKLEVLRREYNELHKENCELKHKIFKMEMEVHNG